jgi:hypothetical protein
MYLSETGVVCGPAMCYAWSFGRLITAGPFLRTRIHVFGYPRNRVRGRWNFQLPTNLHGLLSSALTWPSHPYYHAVRAAF